MLSMTMNAYSVYDTFCMNFEKVHQLINQNTQLRVLIFKTRKYNRKPAPGLFSIQRTLLNIGSFYQTK